MGMTRFTLVAIITIFVWGTGSSIAFAQDEETATFGLRPVLQNPDNAATQSYFVYDAFPGQVIYDQVRLSNTGSVVGTAIVYPVDATTGATSGTVFQSEEDPRQTAGAWVSINTPEREFTLQPGEDRIIPFTVTIPKDARPGHHVAGLVTESIANDQIDSGEAVQVNLRTRVAVAVQINLPGPAVEKLTVTGITPAIEDGFQKLVIGLRNDGTHMVKPSGMLTIADMTGQLLRETPLQLDTFLPETMIDYPVLVPDEALAAGTYRVSVKLSYGEEGTLEYEDDIEIAEDQIEEIMQLAPTQRPPSASARAENSSLTLLVSVIGIGGVIAGVAIILVIRSRRHTAKHVLAPAAKPVTQVVRSTSIRQLRPPHQNRNIPGERSATFRPVRMANDPK